MKKLAFASICVLVICLISVMSLAASCPEHPHSSVEKVVVSGAQQFSNVKHKYDAEEYCSICGRYLGNTQTFEWHNFNDNDVCRDCGYKKTSKDQLNTEAIKASADIIGRELWVLYDGSICNTPNGSTVLKVHANEQYYILNYTTIGNEVWVEVSTTGNHNYSLGWLPASIAGISKRSNATGYESVYIGRGFRITVSSGRGRSGPGTEYPYIETVHYNEVYTILDVAYASNGAAWYKLHVSGNDCWVSSGVGRIN